MYHKEWQECDDEAARRARTPAAASKPACVAALLLGECRNSVRPHLWMCELVGFPSCWPSPLAHPPLYAPTHMHARARTQRTRTLMCTYTHDAYGTPPPTLWACMPRM